MSSGAVIDNPLIKKHSSSDKLGLSPLHGVQAPWKKKRMINVPGAAQARV